MTITLAKNLTFRKSWPHATRDYSHHFQSLELGGGSLATVSRGRLELGSSMDPLGLDITEVSTFLREYQQDATDAGAAFNYVLNDNAGVALSIDGNLALIGQDSYDAIEAQRLMGALGVVVTWDEEDELDAPAAQARSWLTSRGGGILGIPTWSGNLTTLGGKATGEVYVLDRATYGVEVLRRFTKERGHESARLDWQPTTD